MHEQTIEGFRLLPHQKPLWRHLFAPASPASTRSQCAFSLEGALDAARLAEAFRCVVSHHEILRTSFQRLPGLNVPLQVVAESARMVWREVDFGLLREEEVETALSAQWQEELASSWDAERDEVLRVTLAHCDVRRHWLLLSAPAMCADVRSLRNLLDETLELYGAGDRLSPEVRAQRAEPVQYADYAEWQNRLLEAEDKEEMRAYWRGQARTMELRLPLERESTALGHARERYEFSLGDDIIRGVNELAAQH